MKHAMTKNPTTSSSPNSQTRISSFFGGGSSQGKRHRLDSPSSPIDLTSEDGPHDQPPQKKARLSNKGPHSLSAKVIEWKYEDGSSTGSQSLKPKPETTKEKIGRRDALRKKLLSESTPFLRRRSSAAPESFHASVDQFPVLAEKESDPAFAELSRVFAEGGSRVKSSKKHPPKNVEIGPSGETYTPLEKQV
jgi:DNA mismatch repair protein MSH3